MSNESKKSIKTKNNAVKNSPRKIIFIKAAALLLVAMFGIATLPDLQVGAAGTFTGRVFQDFNGDGTYDTDGGTVDAPTAIDAGVAGAVVTAYDSAGVQQGTATSIADGTYSLTATGTGPYRIEFTAPTGFVASARSTNSIFTTGATASGSSVQFTDDANLMGINFAVNRPEEYCQNNPGLATCRFNLGAQNGTFAANSVLQNFAYDSGTIYTDATLANYDAPTAHTLNVPASSVGSVYGLAYNRSTQRIYASAYYKRYVGFGSGVDNTYNGAPTTSDDAGAIYVVNPANNTVVSRFTVPAATANNHSNTAAADITDASWDAVGKTSLGGIALADDDSSLFVMNLQNRTLYALNPTTGASTGSQLVPTPATCTTATDVRPFAVKYYRGNLYVGMVCSAESTQATPANLRAYVYQVDPATLAFGTTPYSFQLNYNRGFNEPAQNNGNTTFPDEWKPWVPTIRSDTGVYVYAQPMLTDIEFDNGNMVLGIRDRLGDQGQDIGGAAGFRPAGDVLRSCGAFTAANFPGTLTLEANGRCGGTGTAPQNTGQGPGATTTAAGSGEFYFQDDFSNPANTVNYHDEVLSGGLLKLPGYAQTITTVFDPISRPVGTNETFDQGFRWLDNTTGATTKAYRLFDGDGNTSNGGEFGKANGLGDVIPLCNSAPIEIGNRVWRDANNNGMQDPSESRAVGAAYVSLAGITVRLYNSANVLVGTAVTDIDGEYYFTSGTAADPDTTDNIGIVNGGILPNTAYQIRFDNAANFATNGVLAGLVPTRANATQQLGNDDASDSDVVRATISGNTVPVINYTTGAAGTNNHTLDAGFATPVSIGSTVFNDVNNNGVLDTGETGINGVTVELYYDADNNGLIDGTEITAITSMATITNGTPATPGNYFFGGLTPGNYQLRIPNAPPTFTVSSMPTNATDSRIDNDDNGTQTGGPGSVTISPIINLTPGAEPVNGNGANDETGQGRTQDDATNDANGDMTVDFGFFAPASIGDTVFSDLDRDGVQDAGEPGINGVTATLYDSLGNPVATTVTATVGGNAGQYLFTGLAPGTYSVGFTLPTGFGYAFTTADQGGNDTTDSDANVTTGRTGNYTLTAGQNNTTVDAGLVQTLSLGNQVFNDTDNNGVRNGAEVGIGGLTVNLYNGNGTFITSTTTSTVPATLGLYLFSGLAPGDYIVGVVTPTNFVSSSVNGGDPDNNTDNDDNGITTVGTETRSNAITLALTTEPTGENPYNEANTPDNSNNLTLDFGFTSSYALGNRVWFDTDNDGSIDAFESGINGVTLTLLDSNNLVYDSDPNTAGVQTLTVTTANGGYYRFNNLPTGVYKVRIDAANFGTGGVLAGYANTTGSNTGDVDSTATLAGENGIDPTTYVGTNLTSPRQAGVLSNPITLGTGASEPTTESDLGPGDAALPNDYTDLTVDFGFYRLNLSGTVWNDNGTGGGTSNNGILDGTEPGIANVRVQLYFGTSTTDVLVGPDGILGTADDAVGGTLTNASGNYSFQNLAPGTYRVVLIANSATSSTGAGNNINPETNVDNDDNGFPDTTGNFSNRTISGTITLTPRGETSSTGTNLWTDSTGTTNNPTVDFGFVGFSPTLVQLDKFDVLTDGSSVELKWSTGNEVGNLGFNVYREVGGKRELLNAAPIAGNALRSNVQLEASGSDYSWTDKTFVPNAVYYLEDLDVNGSVSLHGAVTPEFRQTLGNQPNARMFSDLTTGEDSSGMIEVNHNQKLGSPTVKELAAAQQQQAQIAARGGAKIIVNHDGWYRVSIQQLQAAGFDTNSNPNLWQLFADGMEVPFKMNSDSIEFFGHGLNTQLTDKQVYYLISGRKTGLRVNAVNGGGVEGNADAQSFSVTVERQDRAVYVSALVNGEDNENWFGAVVSRSSETAQNMNAVNVDQNGAAHLSLKLQGVVALDHYVNVRFNDLNLGTVEFSGFENKQVDFDIPSTSVLEGANTVYLRANGAGNDISVVDSIRLSYQRGYTANNNRIRFRVPANQSVRVDGFTNENISVYALRNGAASQQLVGTSESSEGNYGFSLSAANADREMIAIVDSTIEQASVEANVPSTLTSAANQADFVIITANELRDSADTLAVMREAQGLKTKVVLVDDVFDEFSFGSRSPEAVKQFLKTAATKWQTKPQYALLFGDASYDSRNNLGLTVTRDFVPTKMVDTQSLETSSDSWLADFDNDGVEDIAIGRLPVGNASEAATAVEKLARFDNQKERKEKTDVLVADTGFAGYSEQLQTILPSDVRSFRIDRGITTDAETHQNIITQLNNSPLLVTYTGHGSQSVWASSGIFSLTDAAGLNNRELSFYLLMNCLNGYIHQPTGDSLGETLFKSNNSAIAVWTSSGVTNPESQAALSQAFTDLVFNKRAGKTGHIGDVVKAAKHAATDLDVRRTWQLVGDPTVFVK